MKKKYRVTAIIEERLFSSQTLEVTARSPEEAEEICEEDRDFWRNSTSSDRVRIVGPEEAADIETIDIEYTVEQVKPSRKPTASVDAETKARIRREKKLESLHHALRKDAFNLGDEIITLCNGTKVRLPSDVLALLDQYLMGVGSRPVVAEELRAFARAIWNQLYDTIKEYVDPDDALLQLVIRDSAVA